jgi:hypothetical protein
MLIGISVGRRQALTARSACRARFVPDRGGHQRCLTGAHGTWRTCLDLGRSSVRLDAEALRALARIESTGLSRSEAIRKAILDSAAGLRRRDALAAEVAALEADEDDRREMREVADFMESMRAAG